MWLTRFTLRQPIIATLFFLAVAGSALGSSGAPYTLTISTIDLTAVTQPWPTRTLRQAFDADSGWQLSGTGPYYQCTQTFPVTVPGNGPGWLQSSHRHSRSQAAL